MKKNIMLRLSAVLLVAVLLTTCVISGTWAKYTSTGTAEDTARVAKWGVEITATDDADSKAVKDTLDNNDEAHISTAQELKLLAPGTYGDLASVTVSGTPEVAVQVTYEATLTLDGWTVVYDHDDDPATPDVVYCPIVFTVDTTEYKLDPNDENMNEISELVGAVTTALNSKSDEYDPDEDIASAASVSWKWAFAGNDELDTALGDLSTNLLTAPKVEFSLTVTVTQID